MNLRTTKGALLIGSLLLNTVALAQSSLHQNRRFSGNGSLIEKSTPLQMIAKIKKIQEAYKTTGSGLQLQSVTTWQGNGSIFERNGDSTVPLWHPGTGEDLMFTENNFKSLMVLEPHYTVYDPNGYQYPADTIKMYLTTAPGSAYTNYSSRILGTIDANNWLTENINQSYLSNWINSNREQYTYNSNGQILTENYTYWDNNAWQNEDRYTYTYNSQGKVSSELYEDYEPTNMQFINSYKATHTYDVNGNWIEMINQNWTSNAWMDNIKISNQYNGANQIIMQTVLSNNNNNWDTSEIFVFDYSVANQKRINVYSTSLTNPNAQFDYQMAGNNVTSLVVKQYDPNSMTFNNLARYTFSYTNNRATGYVAEQWNGNSWQNIQRLVGEYNTQGLVTKFYTESHDGTGWMKTSNDYQNIFHYEQYLNLKDLMNNQTVQLYPNPADDLLICQTTEQIKNVIVTDAVGRLLLKQNANSNKIMLSTSQFPSGQYYIILETSKGQGVKAFTVK